MHPLPIVQKRFPIQELAMMTVPIIIDFEASGVGPGSYPIEVGFSGRHGEGWCSLIRPEDDWTHWDLDAARIHGIAREILIERGNTTQFVAEQLNFFLGGRTIYSDAWEQDFLWLERLFASAQMTPQFTLVDLFDIVGDDQLPNWDATREQIMKELRVARHRASSDARVLQLTWLRTYDEAKKQTV